MTFHGLRVIESVYLTKPATVERSWRERVFSWPWRPWVATKTMQVPSEKSYMLNSSTIVMHPEMARRLKEPR